MNAHTFSAKRETQYPAKPPPHLRRDRAARLTRHFSQRQATLHRPLPLYLPYFASWWVACLAAVITRNARYHAASAIVPGRCDLVGPNLDASAWLTQLSAF
jgi:hypothetical protein